MSDEIREIGKNTGFQAVIYDENENFQSAEILDNFNYPYSSRKQVKPEYYPQANINDTKTEVARHKIYLQNSVVCLQADWWKAFSFIGNTFNALIGKVVPREGKSNY